jgi:hypothetical protein
MITFNNPYLFKQKRIGCNPQSGTAATVFYQSLFFNSIVNSPTIALSFSVFTFEPWFAAVPSAAFQRPCRRSAKTGRAINNTAIARFGIHCKSQRPLCL